MTTKAMTTASLRKQIVALTKKIGRDRDQLRELIADAESLETSCSEAMENLEFAADCLSRYA